ncbi:unnamed protein product [Dracunculus medinensis]|uniref:Short-chain dehydrogenase/reductase family 16C member 6 n=1 Tax=Dracunculus medinensis TaxID=318479 RepID=A0A0N4U8Z2_DRAME|nr:unnamed protein product [Dracunculus medinensis]
MAKISKFERFCSTFGVILHILFVAIPKDLWNWLNLRQKCVKGQTVVITGAASGIGRALAEFFSIHLGANVVIIDINFHDAQETVQIIKEKCGNAMAWKCDVSQENEIQSCAKEIFTVFGKVDIVVCNAAVLFFGLLHELTNSQLQKSVNINILGTINTIRAFLPQMESRNSGHIVAISSIAGYYGESYGVAYCPTKFAIRGIIECLQMEAKDRKLDIAFTTVCPYFTRTPMILNLGMRPTSIWLPFMSVRRCARDIADAILKEKVIAFVPGYMTILASVKGLLSKNVQFAGREYLNCQYEPSLDEITLSKKSDFFYLPKYLWEFSLFSALFSFAVSFSILLHFFKV